MKDMENREYKSDVFAMLLEDKNNALEVYNALNGSNYTDPDEVEMCKLEGGLSLTLRNDAAFIINMHLNIWEHQSTYCPNMPLRLLFYISDTYKNQLAKDNNKRNIYSRKLIMIPNPKFIVFYSGDEDRPPIEQLKLSASYVHKEDNPELELICTIYNINIDDDDADIRKKSHVLNDYMQFIEKVKANKKLDINDPVEEATKWCIDNHILEDFFRARGGEVIHNMTLDMTFETRLELEKEESREEGREEGIELGLTKGREDTSREYIINMVRIGLSDEQIRQISGCSPAMLAKIKSEL